MVREACHDDASLPLASQRDRVHELAKKHGVLHKLDPSLMDDDSYVSGWAHVLGTFDESFCRCQQTRDVDLLEVDAHSFVATAFELRALKERLHEAFEDWPDWTAVQKSYSSSSSAGSPPSEASFVGEIRVGRTEGGSPAVGTAGDFSVSDSFIRVSPPPSDEVATSEGRRPPMGGSEEKERIGVIHGQQGQQSTSVSLRAYIIDADYEHVLDKCHVVLYTRETAGPDRTALVLCPFNDYFYVEVTEAVSFELIQAAVKGYCWYLKEKRYPASAAGLECQRHSSTEDTRKHMGRLPFQGMSLVVSMELVENLRSMYGYQPDAQTFVKITTVSPVVTRDLFNGLSKKFNGGTRFDEKSKRMKHFPEMRFFEAKTDLVNKFMVQHGISGCAAVDVRGTELPRNEWSTCDRALVADSVSLCDSPDVPFYEPRVMFYDIECLSLDVNTFPTAERCPVIQISYLLARGSETVDKGVLCVRETPGYEWFERESQMLLRFVQLLAAFNPDCVTGYNSNSFDMPYIIDRMKVLGLHEWAGTYLSRRRGLLVDYKRTFKQSKQFGTKETVSYVIPGRVLFDQMQVVKDNAMIRLRSYSLKAVCAEFLGDDNKEDLRYKDIPVLFDSVAGRQKIASYCLQDTVLLKKLDDKRLFGLDAAAQAKVQGITMHTVLNRGLVFRLMCKIKQYTERFGFLIPTFTEAQFPSSPTYQGATVISCEAGFYMDPVVVLDFASLYPSLIRSYNLDYTTIALDKEVVARYPDRFQEFGNGYAFVKSDVQRGLLPRIEAELAVERKNAKKKMKDAADPTEEAVWNAIQGSVKIVMNSIYGLTGSPTASVPCVPIASSITYLGRYNLVKSKDFVEANYCRITGRPESANAEVIYGDTDSIFIKMPGVSNEEAIRYGQQLDNAIKTELFGHLECLVMEYEKVFNPYIQVTAKRYAGWKMEFDASKGKVAASGLQMVKRDSALLCKRTMQTFFEFLLVKKEPKAAEDSVRTMVADLFAGELSIEDFAITKKIAKKPEEYKLSPPAHVVAWERMKDRVGAAETPAVGERFEYIILEHGKKDKLSDAIVDTDLVRERGFAHFNVAKHHYHKLYIENPMKVVLALVYGEERARWILDPKNYEHVETITAKEGKGGNILGFFGKTSVTRKRKWKGIDVDPTFVQRVRQMRLGIGHNGTWGENENEIEN